MLAAKNMLDAITEDKKIQNHQNHNDDYDFKTVLEFCGTDTTHQHQFRYSDGKEEIFTFDN